MTVGSIQLPTEMSTRGKGDCQVGLISLPPSYTDFTEILGA